jgi:uncharacterized membrane protein
MGLAQGNFAPVYTGLPDTVPGREALVWLSSLVSLACGIGLFWRRTAPHATRALFLFLVLWMLAVKVRVIIMHPLTEGSYQSWGETAVLVAAAWILCGWFRADGNGRWARFGAGERSVRLAQVLLALALVAFGLSHMVYLELTAPLVPGWLPAPVFWAYFTGGTFLLAGIAILANIHARLAAALTTLQIGLFTLLVWVPMVAAGNISEHRWVESVASWAITTAAWVVAESWRGTPWFARRRRPA